MKDDVLLARLEVESATIVDSALSGSYTVPFSPVPAVITLITSWIWCYRIYRHREVMDIPKSVMDDYNRALEWLKLMATGEMPIGGSDGLPAVAAIDMESSPVRGWTRRSEFET